MFHDYDKEPLVVGLQCGIVRWFGRCRVFVAVEFARGIATRNTSLHGGSQLDLRLILAIAVPPVNAADAPDQDSRNRQHGLDAGLL